MLTIWLFICYPHHLNYTELKNVIMQLKIVVNITEVKCSIISIIV